jgi:hypothetical protein
MDGIINGLTDLYPEEAMEEIKWAYKNHLVDETIIGAGPYINGPKYW